MISLLFQDPISFLIFFAALIIVITIHEFAHAAVADALGDDTPRYSGRLTINPLEHLDPLGIILFLFSGFGWGKPVPVNPLALTNPRLGSALVSLAGPGSNLGLAFLLSLVARTLHLGSLPGSAAVFLVYLIQFNIILAVFNLLPINPLDGFKIVAGLLPPDLADSWLELKDYGLIILIVLLLPFGSVRLLDLVMDPAINFIQTFLLTPVF